MMLMIGQKEEFSRVTPLGLRFWDTLSENSVGEGLTVSAYPSGDPSRRVEAISNRLGIYLLQNLPGLRELEFSRGDADYWSMVPKKPFVIAVTDPHGRFQPFTFHADLPFRDVLTSPCVAVSSPPDLADVPGIPLYSAVTRPVPSGTAVIYAQLWDSSNDRPASWAVVEALFDHHFLARGFADREGRLALVFPYPEPSDSASSPPSSPPLGNAPSLLEQTWPVELHAFYKPQQPIPEIPDLCQTLNQSPATLLSTLSPAFPLTEVILHYGQELVVRSESQSIVWIVP